MGLESSAPFDVIHVGAAAATVPEALKKQLKIGGKLIVPVGQAGHAQELQLITRKSDTEWTTTTVCGVLYVPLTDSAKQLSGQR
jgi:protein-L-isoaspartate(D-aspartate) O-methyltransferase